ncbi:MAG: pirin family protein [Archangium sp.]|nr:pirin family protein [Archangium sp.]
MVFPAQEPSLEDRSGRILFRTQGHHMGPVTRLISPGDLGELLKPFVFLDRFEAPGARGVALPVHPHSGLATHTTLLSGSSLYADSTGKAGVLEAGDVEWMRASGGVWHGGAVLAGQPVHGFQLWVAMPAKLELAPAESQYVRKTQVPGDERVRLLLGSYQGQHSATVAPSDVTYLHVRLGDGEVWRYQSAASHAHVFVALARGALLVGGTRLGRELAVFAAGEEPIEFLAHGDTEFIVDSGARHPHPLVTGMYSVHTSAAALERGEAGIEALANTMALEPGGFVTPELVRRFGGSAEVRRLQAV